MPECNFHMVMTGIEGQGQRPMLGKELLRWCWGFSVECPSQACMFEYIESQLDGVFFLVGGACGIFRRLRLARGSDRGSESLGRCP